MSGESSAAALQNSTLGKALKSLTVSGFWIWEGVRILGLRLRFGFTWFVNVVQ